MHFEKHFIESSDKDPSERVLIRTHEPPFIGETFQRVNRAGLLGGAALQRAEVILSARTREHENPELDCEWDEVEYEVELPLHMREFAELPELNVEEDGTGLFWMRLTHPDFDIYTDNPQSKSWSTYGVFISVDNENANPDHIRWQCADALMTPSNELLPGALGDMSLRLALIEMKAPEA